MRQLTFAPHGHILTHCGVWSPDSRRIVYDVRSDPAGDRFDGTRIETVDIASGATRVLYESRNGACCGVVTYHPQRNRVIFIHGPEEPTTEWSYGAAHRQGVMVDEDRPGIAIPLDARNLLPPFTPGALRGGSHVHVFRSDGRLVSFTYEDHVLGAFQEETATQDVNLRNIGVSVVDRPVYVPREHPRNHDGTAFSVLVTQTTAHPKPGSDEIQRAFEEGWIGQNGYRRSDGTWQRDALAFQGHVVTARGKTIAEVFVVDLPEDLTKPGTRPLEGTSSLRPFPPFGTCQRRLTYTADRIFPGIQGPRHWLRTSPDGSQIAFLMKDDEGIVQLWTIHPNGGQPRQLTTNRFPIASAFTWSPDGRQIAHVMDGSICTTEVTTGKTRRWTEPYDSQDAPRPEACVFSPDGQHIAFVRSVATSAGRWNQIWVCSLTG